MKKKRRKLPHIHDMVTSKCQFHYSLAQFASLSAILLRQIQHLLRSLVLRTISLMRSRIANRAHLLSALLAFHLIILGFIIA
jgi:hypothetical protein